METLAKSVFGEGLHTSRFGSQAIFSVFKFSSASEKEKGGFLGFLRILPAVAGILDATESKKSLHGWLAGAERLFEGFVFAPEGSLHSPMRFPFLMGVFLRMNIVTGLPE